MSESTVARNRSLQITRQALVTGQTRRNEAGRGGAEQRATLGALGDVWTGEASLAPAPAGSMTPRWLAGRGGVG